MTLETAKRRQFCAELCSSQKDTQHIAIPIAAVRLDQTINASATPDCVSLNISSARLLAWQ